MQAGSYIIAPDDLVLVTGANGFIGSKVVETLRDRGFRNLRCFARRSTKGGRLEALRQRTAGAARIEIVHGNLLSPEDCANATKAAKVVYHLAAGRGEKSYPDAFANSVVTTRNLLEGCVRHQTLLRFVNISSFAVYSNREKPRGRLLDESCPIEERSDLRGEAYCFAKVKQDEMLAEYGRKFGIPYVIVRPGYVFGPGNLAITDRVGIDTFGVFLHCGGANRIPFTYIDNCADAIALAGLAQGIDGEVFNVVDDDLPTSRQFLRLYKRKVRNFRSLYVPHVVSFVLSSLWERYSVRSQGQLPPSFNRRRWHSYWKKTFYSNQKLKTRIGWMPRVSMTDGLDRYFESCRGKNAHA
jgi:nucleoside-diphosphate-sugar epimerase